MVLSILELISPPESLLSRFHGKLNLQKIWLKNVQRCPEREGLGSCINEGPVGLVSD